MSQIAPVLIKKDIEKTTTWRYILSDKRDLRIDFMRGIALVMMVVAHTEVMSIFNIFTWERFGLTTGAEGFVILSGFMLGMLNRARLQKAVLLTISWGLYLRKPGLTLSSTCKLALIKRKSWVSIFFFCC